VPPGTYTVSEQQQSGWVATTPASVTVTVPPAALNVNFGNRRAVGEVCVLKFHDLNQNGVQDAGEPGLAGWSFVVSPPPLGLGTNVVTTLSGGGVCFGVSAPGTYTITELGQPGWTPTTPTTQTVTVQPGQAVNVVFGNRLPCVRPPADLVAWWPFDETSGTTANDIAGFPNSGAHVNGPTPTPGKVAGALCFDGVDDYVRVPDHPELNVGTGDFTLDAWVLTTAAQGVVVLVDKRSGPTPLGYVLFLVNGRLGFQMANGVGSVICAPTPTPGVSCVNYGGTGPNVADGQWHHVAAVVDRADTTNGVRLYVDGNLVFTGAPLSGNLDNTSDLYMGVRTPGQGGGGFFAGCLDEVELFKRALDPAEIQAIYTAGPAGKCRPQHGQICVLKFHDLNQNGVRDAGEPALPGWTIQIKDSAGNVIQSIVTATNPVCVSVPAGVYQVSEVLPPPIGVWLPWTPTVPSSGTYSNVTVLPGQSVTLMFGNRKMIKVFNPVLVPSPLRVILRMTAEPGEWYQLQYSETLGEGAVWRDWGDPVQATEPEVRFEVPVTSDQRQLYFRGIEKKDIRRGF
jgi:hypothetical protein